MIVMWQAYNTKALSFKMHIMRGVFDGMNCSGTIEDLKSKRKPGWIPSMPTPL